MNEARDWLWDHGFKGVNRCGSFAAARAVVSKAIEAEMVRLTACDEALTEAREMVGRAQKRLDAQHRRIAELRDLVAQLTAKLEAPRE